MNSFEESSLYQLTVTRFLLFLREPEAIFWVFLFPILLALGLGIAFRNRPADVLQVGATSTQLTAALNRDKGLTAATMDEVEGTHELATGRILLLAIERPGGRRRRECSAAHRDSRHSIASCGRGRAPAFRYRDAHHGAAHLLRALRTGAASERVSHPLRHP